MIVTKPKFHKFNYARISPTTRFRTVDYRLGKRQHNLVFTNEAMNNSIYQYELITVPLLGGTYQFKINSTDNLGNVNTGVTTSAVLADLLWYPTSFVITNIDTNDVTFTWEHPEGGLTALNYVIYGNGGVGYQIDRGTPLATLPATSLGTTINGLSNGEWYFVIEAKDASSETVNYFVAQTTLPIEDIVPPGPNDPNNPADNPFDEVYRVRNIQLMNKSVGKCGIEFLWYYGDKASHFRIYHDSGTGTIDWGTYAFRYERLNNILQSFVTDQIVTEEGDFPYKFGVRAESPDGVVEDNVMEYEVLLDGKAPNEVTNVVSGDI